MQLIAIIDLPDDHDYAPDVITEAVLARVEDECGYDENTNPFTPGEVTVHAFTTSLDGLGLIDDLAAHAAATAIGHGPL